MSLDRIQFQPGMVYITPLPDPSGNNGGATIAGLSVLPASTSGVSGGALAFRSPALQTHAGNGETITHNQCGVHFVTSAAARTGMILQAGTTNGQCVTVVHLGAAVNTLTFNTTDATALVYLASATIALAGGRAHEFVWSTSLGLWVYKA